VKGSNNVPSNSSLVSGFISVSLNDIKKIPSLSLQSSTQPSFTSLIEELTVGYVITKTGMPNLPAAFVASTSDLSRLGGRFVFG